MIHFNDLYIEGYGSFVQPFKFSFLDQGLTLIKGENGAGKTTLFSSLSWIIYDRPLKEKGSVMTWEHLRPPTYKGVKGSVTITKDGKTYKIYRCKDYKGEIIPGVKGENRLIITDENDNDLFTQKKKQQVQAEINNLMGMSYEVFKVCLVFGQKMKRLIEEDGPTKKKIFEEAFDAAFITRAKDIAQKKYNLLQKEYIPLDKEYFGLTQKVESQKVYIKNLIDKKANFEDSKKSRIKGIQDEISNWEEEIKEIEAHKDEYLKHTEELKELKIGIENLKKKFDYDNYIEISNKITRQNTFLYSYKKSLEDNQKKLAKAQKSSKCPTCGAEMVADTRQEHIDDITQSINQITTGIADTERSLNGHKIMLASLLKKKNAIDSKIIKMGILEELISNSGYDLSEINRLKKYINNAHKEIIRIGEEQINFGEEEAISELLRLETEVKKVRKDLRKVKVRYETQGWLYSEALSNSGLKAFIFNKRLYKLNVILEQYSKTLGIRPYFEVDMDGARKDIKTFIQKDGHNIPFEDLSGGQAQIANVIIAFATHDLMAKGKFNILILDEIFESLTSSSIEVVTDLIMAKTTKQHVYLITHLKDFNPTGASILEFKLQDGVSRPLL